MWKQAKIQYKPMKTMPFLCSSSGNLGFSEAWPQPAHTACTFVRFAMSKISWTFA